MEAINMVDKHLQDAAVIRSAEKAIIQHKLFKAAIQLKAEPEIIVYLGAQLREIAEVYALQKKYQRELNDGMG